MNGIRNQQDVLTTELTNQPEIAASTYQLLINSEQKFANQPALTFFLQTAEFKRARCWNYRQLLAAVNQTANLFHSLGTDKDTVIAYILPNLPETHFVIWGGQASGIVAAINPLLEADAMAELLNAANARILVT